MEGDLSVFSAPTEMTFGPRASARAGGLARGLGAARMFAVTDRGVFEAEVLGPAQNPPLPVIAIPTTAGSGNEVSSWALPGRCPTAASRTRTSS